MTLRERVGGCLGSAVLTAVLTFAAVPGAFAQATTFENQTIDLYVAGSGALELHSRLIAPYLQKHLPGNPDIVVRSMPGAGGMVLANWLYNVAPRDGTAIANFLPYFAISQAVGVPEVQYDAARFAYLGSLAPINSVLATWNETTQARSFEEIRDEPVKLGATSRSSITYIGPTFTNRFLGTDFQIVMGYQGTAPIMQAMESGELNGRVADYEGIVGPYPHWIEQDLVTIHFHTGLDPDASLPGVPRLLDLATSDDEREILRFLANGSALGRVFVAPPELPDEVVATLEAAFAAAANDPAYRAEMAERGMQVAPKRGAEIEAIVSATLEAPDRVIESITDIFRPE
ncbi:tripartite tricarboxylate transporter substrate-binding protein [Salinarimonas rosea]|uniref:tripartite tricarboxylate transporter substrate-binding protein n=1 Tax=Salinarimonas rosea TaxID=552063 RepID=UPI000A07B0A1|nr:tripartite tricarboxylate transporter substrate-binding protein [Salinarimonas rosea]